MRFVMENGPHAAEYVDIKSPASPYTPGLAFMGQKVSRTATGGWRTTQTTPYAASDSNITEEPTFSWLTVPDSEYANFAEFMIEKSEAGLYRFYFFALGLTAKNYLNYHYDGGIESWKQNSNGTWRGTLRVKKSYEV